MASWADIPCEIWISYILPELGRSHSHTPTDVGSFLYAAEACIETAIQMKSGWNNYVKLWEPVNAIADARERYKKALSVWDEVMSESAEDCRTNRPQPLQHWENLCRAQDAEIDAEHREHGACIQCFYENPRSLAWLSLRLVCRTWNAWIMATPELWYSMYQQTYAFITDEFDDAYHRTPALDRGTFVLYRIMLRDRKLCGSDCDQEKDVIASVSSNSA